MTTTTDATSAIGTSTVAKQAASVVKNDAMDQTDFLRLLTAQMQSQDPFNPMSNSEMVAQMATITNSTGIAEMNATLKSIASGLTDSRLGGAASWIGHSMLVESNIATPDADGFYVGQFTLPEAAENVSVDFVNGDGQVVKTIDMGAREAGDTNFYWDGKDETGAQIATGSLQIRVRGATPSQVASWTSVAAVQSPADGSAARLITPLGAYAPEDALKLA